MSTYATIDPSSGAPIAEYTTMSPADIDTSLTRSADAYRSWSVTPLAQRAHTLAEIGRLHRTHAEQLARIIAKEMGKPITQGKAEVELVASVYEYYAEHATELMQDEVLDHVVGGRALIRTAPIGVILGIMPWNFPLLQVARFVAPNLLLGNTILLKHARSCTQTALAIDELIKLAGAPIGIYENVNLPGSEIGDVIGDPRVQGVSITGSEAAGRSVAEIAGRHLKKCVLELGGSDPFIVLPDADMGAALEAAERGRFLNAGQVCSGSKRMIVHSDIWDTFLEQLIARAQQWSAGDPQDESTLLGPMASVEGRSELVELVEDALNKGATAHLGGTVPDGPGAYYPITVLSGVTPEMRAYHEELFGPVAVLYRVEDADEAVRLANDTRFGLGAAVFTRDDDLANDIAARLEAGMVGLNTIVRSQPALPFGGVKASGIGRELGRLGLDEFANKKLLRYM